MNFMEQQPETADSAGDTEPSSLAVIAASIGAYFGRMPAALQKNFTKAAGHLFKVPNAFLDGLADEIKATSAARVKITEATGNKLAESISVDSSLAQIAVQTHASKILRQQKNTIKILQHASEEVSNSPASENAEEVKEISDDWLNAFESEAVNMSSEQMQRLFGKMLAGEIRKPSSYSIRTIKLMGQMDSDVAEIFRRFCSACCSHKFGKERVVVDGRVLMLGEASSSSLLEFGLPYRQLLMLDEYGLIAGTEGSRFPYDMSFLREHYDGTVPVLPFAYNNEFYMLHPKPPKKEEDFKGYGIFGVALSRVGRELLNVVELEEDTKYTKSLMDFFDREGLTLVKVSDYPG